MITPNAVVWITTDVDNGIALVTGKAHDGYVFEINPQAKWSRAGKGWLLSLPEAADLHSLCWALSVPCREKARTA